MTVDNEASSLSRVYSYYSKCNMHLSNKSGFVKHSQSGTKISGISGKMLAMSAFLPLLFWFNPLCCSLLLAMFAFLPLLFWFNPLCCSLLVAMFAFLPHTTFISCVIIRIDLTRFNKIAIQGAPQMAVDKEAISLSRIYSYYSKCNLPLFYV